MGALYPAAPIFFPLHPAAIPMHWSLIGASITVCPPPKSLASDPASGEDACLIAFKSHKEHLGRLFLASCPVVFVCLQTARSKNSFSYGFLQRIQVPKNKTKPKHTSVLVFILHAANE